MTTVKAPSAAPIRKVTAGGLAGAIVTIAVYVLNTLTHTTTPDYVAAAAVVIVSFAVAYLVPSAASDGNPT